MADKQLIQKYLREKYPIGAEIHDSVRSGGPYVVNKRTVFEVHPWKADDYNPDFLPDDPETYYIEFLVRNPGKYSVTYGIPSSDMRSIRYWFEYHKNKNYAR